MVMVYQYTIPDHPQLTRSNWDKSLKAWNPLSWSGWRLVILYDTHDTDLVTRHDTFLFLFPVWLTSTKDIDLVIGETSTGCVLVQCVGCWEGVKPSKMLGSEYLCVITFIFITTNIGDSFPQGADHHSQTPDSN